jgi:hypothetical protein
MYRLGAGQGDLRLAPPTMNYHGARAFSMSARAWPCWFERVCDRLPGVRLAAKYGRRALQPVRKIDETWEMCFYRTCIEGAPEWISARANDAMMIVLRRHAAHSNTAFPDSHGCPACVKIKSWKNLVKGLYCGDPFSTACTQLPYVEPEFFRPGAGLWDGKPAF